jgi:hypothetical protein
MSYKSFLQRYEDDDFDPFKGSYGSVLSQFVAGDKRWKRSELAVQVVDMEPEHANAYVGLFHDADHPSGTTRLLHASRRFAAKLGQPSKFDGEYFAILDDVVDGSVQAVEFKESFFDCTSKISLPISGEAALAMLYGLFHIENAYR